MPSLTPTSSSTRPNLFASAHRASSAMMDMASDPAEAQPLPTASSFRCLAVDGRGSLLEMHCSTRSGSIAANGERQASAKDIESETASDKASAINILNEVKGAAASKGDFVVQKSARGVLRQHKVIALARKDGRIDVFSMDQRAKAGSLKPLITLHNTEMKKGIHRWAGLAVAHDGIFACTSAGDFRFYSIEQEEGSNAAVQRKPAVQRELPEPLQQVTFTPSSDPTHFAYGGEEIPLSVWDARQAILPAPDADADTMTNGEENEALPANAETENGSLPALNGKARKRKRAAENRAKARELHWGEVWRAKNLPNDALSLPQRADIVSTTFVGGSTNKLAVGTRSGLVRIFDTTQQRRHTKEYRVFAQEKSAVKQITSSYAGTELIVSDTAGRVFVLDAECGSVLYQYKGIHGAVVAWDILSPMQGEPDQSYLVTASADRLVRLHSIPVEASSEFALRKSTKAKGAIVDVQFVREGVSAIAWDGDVPTAADDSHDTTDHHGNDENGVDGEGEIADDGMWDAMATVNDVEKEKDEGEEDVEHAIASRESRSKRRR